MTLDELITALEAADPTLVVEHGFNNPHSYRGDYLDLAFEPTTNITVGAMLADARAALGATYQGYKGGEFTMTADTWCWLSAYGDASCETLSPLALQAMLADPAAPPAPADADLRTLIRGVIRDCPALYPDDIADAVLAVLPAPADRATLKSMFEGLARLLATSSRDWGTYRVDAWLYAVLVGWDCEQTEHDETCVHGAMEEVAELHGWDADTVAKARRYRAAVRRISDEARQPEPWDAPDARPGTTDYTLQQRHEQADRVLDERVAAAKEQSSFERSDVGTEFVQQIDNLDVEALAKVEAELVESGVETPGCDCGHDGMGVRWHGTACMWRSGKDEARQADAAGEGR